MLNSSASQASNNNTASAGQDCASMDVDNIVVGHLAHLPARVPTGLSSILLSLKMLFGECLSTM